MYRLELLQMIGRGPFENTRTGEVFWLGPGVALPYLPGDTFGAPPSYAGAVLDAVGHEVERDLTWEWPTAYNGPQRRAAVRVTIFAHGRHVSESGVVFASKDCTFSATPTVQPLLRKVKDA